MGKDYSKVENFLFICNGSDCKSSGAKELEKMFSYELKYRGLKDKTVIIKTKCTGRCKEAPVVIVNENWLTKVKPRNVEDIVRDAFDDEGK